jgi:hypothetical protein
MLVLTARAGASRWGHLAVIQPDGYRLAVAADGHRFPPAIATRVTARNGCRWSERLAIVGRSR